MLLHLHTPIVGLHASFRPAAALEHIAVVLLLLHIFIAVKATIYTVTAIHLHTPVLVAAAVHPLLLVAIVETSSTGSVVFHTTIRGVYPHIIHPAIPVHPVATGTCPATAVHHPVVRTRGAQSATRYTAATATQGRRRAHVVVGDVVHRIARAISDRASSAPATTIAKAATAIHTGIIPVPVVAVKAPVTKASAIAPSGSPATGVH